MPRELWIHHPNIVALLAEGQVSIVPDRICRDFWSHLARTYPLVPIIHDSIAWEEVPDALRVKWATISDDETVEFVRRTRLGKHRQAIAVYSETQPGLRCDLAFVLYHLEALFITAHHAVYLFGVDDRAPGETTYYYDDFVELDLDDELWLSGIRAHEQPGGSPAA